MAKTKVSPESVDMLRAQRGLGPLKAQKQAIQQAAKKAAQAKSKGKGGKSGG